jgi:hypothetical protein
LSAVSVGEDVAQAASASATGAASNPILMADPSNNARHIGRRNGQWEAAGD